MLRSPFCPTSVSQVSSPLTLVSQVTHHWTPLQRVSCRESCWWTPVVAFCIDGVWCHRAGIPAPLIGFHAQHRRSLAARNGLSLPLGITASKENILKTYWNIMNKGSSLLFKKGRIICRVWFIHPQWNRTELRSSVIKEVGSFNLMIHLQTRNKAVHHEQ